MNRILKVMILLTLVQVMGGGAWAASLRVAVASNFKPALERLKVPFERQSGHRLELSAGSSGKLFAQILEGAPYDVFLAADQDTVARLEEKRALVPGTRFTYAQGELVLVGAPHLAVGIGPLERLKLGEFSKLAIANPKLAPYGRAALEWLESLGLPARYQSKLVLGENVSQAYQFVATGNAELGIIARSLWLEKKQGVAFAVPEREHQPILQDAALLKNSKEQIAAQSFLDYLKGPEARTIIRESGYL